MKLNKKLIIVIIAAIVILFLFRNSREMLKGDDKPTSVKKMLKYVETHKTTLSKDPFYITSQIMPHTKDKILKDKIIEASEKNDFQTVISILKSL